jgi:type IV secretory pathway TraG/TraD family ATPase VirD4
MKKILLSLYELLVAIFEFIVNVLIELGMILVKILYHIAMPKQTKDGFATAVTIASIFEKGFVIGKYVRLSRKKSFESLMIVGATGSGKTSLFLIKNILALKNCSMVINDPSKELWDKTSGYLSKFFILKILSFADSEESSGYNPLSRIKRPSDINRLAELLIRSTLEKGGNSDPFWSLQSKSILILLIKLALHQDKKYQNLANVLHMANTLAGDEETFDSWVVQTGDVKLLSEYKAFCAMPEKTRLNVIASLRASLEMFSDPEIAKTTAYDSIDFDELRKEDTVLFIHNSITNQRYLNCLTGIFLEQFYASVLDKPVEDNDKDLFIILEETASIFISNLALYLANLRKYRCGSILCLQSPQQLKNMYREDADNIVSQCITKIYLPGHSNIQMMKELELLAGNYTYTDTDGNEHSEQLLDVQKIRELPDGNCLILSSNNRIIKGETSPYYKSYFYDERARFSSVALEGDIPKGEIPIIGVNL